MQEQINDLKKVLTKIQNLLYGNPEDSKEISLVSKVNMIFNDISSIKKWFGASIVVIISSSIFLGTQLKAIDENSVNIRNFIEREQNIEARLIVVETKVDSLIDGNVDVKKIGNIETVRYSK